MRRIQLHTRWISIISDPGIHRDWDLRILSTYMPWRSRPFNKGAGYIGGFTIYICWNCVDHKSMYKPHKKLQFGITRNANAIPWTRH